MKCFFKRRFWAISGILTLVSLVLFLLFRISVSFSDWFSVYPASFFRWITAFFSSFVPFSVFEATIGAYVIFLVILIGEGICLLIGKKKKRSGFLRRLSVAVLIPILVTDLFVFTFAASYSRRGVADLMALDTEHTEQEEVFSALESLSSILNETVPLLAVNENGESLAAYDFAELSKRVNGAADAFAERNGFFQRDGFSAKRFLTSRVMTYTHLSGVYGFFTGEACVNTNYPHFIVAASTAHELAHARGIAPENECNFLATVMLIESEDAYLRYCGAFYLFDEISAVCRRLDRERTDRILSETDATVQRDAAAFSRFFEPYRDSAAAKLADGANDMYLKSMGQSDGTVSYSRVVSLLAAYFAA